MMAEQMQEAPLSTADMVAATRGEPVRRDAEPPLQQAATASEHAEDVRLEQPDPRTNGAAQRRSGGSNGNAPQAEPLMPGSQASGYHDRWMEIQTGFVDEPRRAVEQADQLVAEVIKRIAEVFADERGKLEAQWGRGDEVDTEALRQALRRYRSFFERLLAA